MPTTGVKKHQAAWLGGQWRYLLILDAARADMTCKRWPRFKPVAALGGITHLWCAKLWELVKEPMTYISANPVTASKLRKVRAPHVHMVNVAVRRLCWREWHVDGQRLGSVHPNDLNRFVLEWLVENPLPRRLVIHYLQPHTPYIAKPLPMQAGNLHDGPTGKHGDKNIAAAVKAGRLTWKRVQASYAANLRLGMRAALDLAEVLTEKAPGRVIITSDHGEALGEKGYWGHTNLPFSLIHQVPIWSSGDGAHKN